jgi:hypothetical protein
MAAPCQEQSPALAASVAHADRHARSGFSAPMPYFPRAMASFPGQFGRVNALKQIEIDSGTRRHATYGQESGCEVGQTWRTAVPPALPCSHRPFTEALRGQSTPGTLGPADPWVGAFTVADGAGCVAELYEMLRRGARHPFPGDSHPKRLPSHCTSSRPNGPAAAANRSPPIPTPLSSWSAAPIRTFAVRSRCCGSIRSPICLCGRRST